MDKETLDVVEHAIRRVLELHPRPLAVNQKQAAEMLGKSHVTVRKLIRAGVIRLNRLGDIPIGEIDRLLMPDEAR